MQKGEFLAKITSLGASLAAAARSVSKLTNLPAERILDDVTTEARACLMRWRWKPPENGDPQGEHQNAQAQTPTPQKT